MKQCRKVLALVLALVMLLSAVSAGIVASATNVKKLYTGAALNNKMNKADSYELDDEQYASIILDFADKALAKANIAPFVYPVTNGLRISVNAKSINTINSTIMGIKTLIDKVNSLGLTVLGDIQSLDLSDFTANTARDGNTSASDVRFISALISLLSKKKNYEPISKLVKNGVGDGGFSAGVLNNTINSMAGDIVNDIVGFLKQTLFQNKNANIDTEVATLITDLLNGMDLEMLEGYTFESSDTLYSTIDKLARVLTNWAIKNVQADTWHIKDSILDGMPSFEKDYPFIKLDNITRISWSWEQDGMGTKFVAGNASTYLVYHVNNCIGTIVETIIPEFKTFKGSFSTAGWTKDNSTNSLSTFNDNIAKAAQFADIKLNNGGTFTEEDLAGMTTAQKTRAYAMVLADVMLKMFFPGIKVEKSDIKAGNIATLAVCALNEFMAYYIPDNVLTDLYTYGETGPQINHTKYTESYCRDYYKVQLAQLLAKFVSGYLPEQSGKLEFSNKNNLDLVLKDIAKYFMNVICKAGSLSVGAIGTVSSDDTVYTAVDRIIFSLNSSGVYQEGASSSGKRNVTGIIPEGFLPDSIKGSGHTHCTSKDLIDHLFSCVNNLNFGDLLKVLVPNSSNSEMNTSLFPNLVSYELIRIINVIFPGTWTSKTGSLNALITNENLGNMLANIMKSLDINYHVYPGLKLVSTIMGLSTAQTRGEAEVSLGYKFSDSLTMEIQPQIASTSDSIPANYCINVNNTSKGINGGYHSNTGSEIQYTPYKIKVNSIVCTNCTDEENVVVSGVSSTSIIKSDESMQFPISGTADTGKVLEFLVTYQMSNEMDNKYCQEQQSRLYVLNGSPESTAKSSNSITVTMPTKIYGTPSMFNNAIAYYRTSDASATYTGAAEDSVFPTALTNAGFTFKAANTGTPESTYDTQFNPFSVSVPGSVEIKNYAGSYNLTYNLKTKDTNNEGGDYGSNVPISTTWVLFDDGGLEDLVSSYEGRALQSGDFSDVATWNAFCTEFNKAERMLKNPGAYGSTAAELQTAFAAEVETLKASFEALMESSTADYTELLKSRLVEYADGDPENDIRPLYSRWDYATVGYARYDSSLSTVRSYYNNKESSSIKVTEALRYNEEMAKASILFADSVIEVSKPKALANLRTLYNAYNPNRSAYTATKYTPGSIDTLFEALDQAGTVIAGTGLDGHSAPKISDYADARSDILAALNKLVSQPLDIAALNTLVTQAKEQYADNMYYTEDAWNVYQKALDAADKVINDPYSFLDEDYTQADVNAMNARITSEFIPQMQAAVQTLQDNPYISSLAGTAQGTVAFDFGKKVVAGAKVIEASEYIVVPYGYSIQNIMDSFVFSHNTSRYTKDDQGNWNTYSSIDGTPTFKVFNASGKEQTNKVTKVRSDWTVQVTSTGYNQTFTIVVTANVGNDAISGPKFNAAHAKLATILPNVIANVGVDALKDAEVLACDLNGDGMVDNTDLVLLKMWQSSKWEPYHVNI